jgi:pumilio family protein 6
MPSATTTKPGMNGTKRKGAPVKDSHVKQNKKPKTDSGLKSALKKEKVKPAPVKQIEDLSDSDDDSEGGAPLNGAEDAEPNLNDSDNSEEDEEIPTVGDGVHPERAKAAAVSSMLITSPRENDHSNKKQANLRKKHTRNKSNWQTSEKQQNHLPSPWLVRRRYGNDYAESPTYRSTREKHSLRNYSK